MREVVLRGATISNLRTLLPAYRGRRAHPGYQKHIRVKQAVYKCGGEDSTHISICNGIRETREMFEPLYREGRLDTHDLEG
jgi:hypothetical protein